ncbi:MAG: cell wall-binding repeat-containing protein [Clostridium sp.]
MKKSSKVISSLLVGGMILLNTANVFAVETNSVIKEKILAGNTRYESAIAVSESGWTSADNVILVNGTSLVDALSATPFAKVKNAPILLTQKDGLNENTKQEIKRLNAKKVYVIGGEGVISAKVIEDIKGLGLKSERVWGNDRFETSLNIAKQLNTKSVAIVNGLNGRLADAMSIASPAARDNMAIIVTDGKDSNNAEKFIKENNINNSYIIGGQTVVSNEVENKLNSKRLHGQNRLETNGEVLKEFYTNKEIENIYVAKDGASREMELVDALSAGALAARENNPVMLVGNEVSDSQKEFLVGKEIKNTVKVGYGVNDGTIQELYNVLNVLKIVEVKDAKEFEKAVKKAKDGDLIKFDAKTEVKENLKISTNKDVTVELNGVYSGLIEVNMKNGDLINNGKILNKITINDVKEKTFINNGQVEEIIVKDNNGASIVNKDTAKINKIKIEDNSKINLTGSIKEVKVTGENSKVNLSQKGSVESLLVEGERNNITIGKDYSISLMKVNKDVKKSNIKNEGTINKAIVESKDKNVEIDNLNGHIINVEGNKNSIVKGSENVGDKKPSNQGDSSSQTPGDNNKPGDNSKPVDNNKPGNNNSSDNSSVKASLIDKSKSSIREVQYVYYAVVKLEKGTINNSKFYINGQEVKASKVNTEGTIVKIELEDGNKKELKVVQGDKEDTITLRFRR